LCGLKHDNTQGVSKIAGNQKILKVANSPSAQARPRFHGMATEGISYAPSNAKVGGREGAA